ncbi:MAG: hypothetical protein ACE5H8_08280 [Alphaproteobacteria bacterium]
MTDHTLAENAASSPSPESVFIEQFTARIPRDVAESFDQAQMRAIVAAFGARRWKNHTTDLRLSFRFLGRHYYFVLLSGRERRTRERRRADGARSLFGSVGNTVVAAVFFGILLGVALAAAYAVKSLFGVDVFAGSSGDIFSLLR